MSRLSAKNTMSISVGVSLMSGRSASVEADLDSSVQELKQAAQTVLGVGKGQLLDSSGGVLNEQSTLQKAKLQAGDSLTLRIRQVHVQACNTKWFDGPSAFATILGDGSVVTWGNADSGGDSSAVQDQLNKRAAHPSQPICLCCDPW